MQHAGVWDTFLACYIPVHDMHINMYINMHAQKNHYLHVACARPTYVLYILRKHGSLCICKTNLLYYIMF